MQASKLRFWMSFWPTFRAAGIRISRISDDYREVDLELRAGWLNMNYVGSHFGGSLFSMTDPFYAIMLMNILGREYIVWDKSASIEFIKPGKGTVSAQIRITDDMLAEVNAQTVNTGDRYYP
jgi:acyl-coenzyme A thioesterase PaaI-like protein